MQFYFSLLSVGVVGHSRRVLDGPIAGMRGYLYESTSKYSITPGYRCFLLCFLLSLRLTRDSLHCESWMQFLSDADRPSTVWSD